jgi:hypothetical protein
MDLQFDEVMVSFNEKYIDGRYFMENNNGTNEISLFLNLKIEVEAPITVNSDHF